MLKIICFIVGILALQSFGLAQTKDTLTQKAVSVASDNVSANVNSTSSDSSEYRFGYFRGGLSGSLAYSHPGDEVVLAGGLTLVPGFHLVQSKNHAVTLSIPLTLGIGSNNTYSYGVLDLPGMLDLHFGSATGNNKRAKAGIILGIGVGKYYSYNFNKNTDIITTANVWGPRYQAGFVVDRTSDPVLIMFHYGNSFSSSGGKVFGISVQGVIKGKKSKKKSNRY